MRPSWRAVLGRWHPRRLRIVVRLPRRPWIVPVLVLAIVLTIAALAGTGYKYAPPPAATFVAGEPAADAASLRRELRRLAAQVKRAAPAGLYIVIERNENRVQLRRGDRVLRTMVCSAGSGRVLEEPGGQGRRWVFDTPTGRFEVISKIRNPVWKKPDWAFVEEGEPIPEDPGERFEYGALGEYGLYFGDGYLIHGTLYERLLGRAATHGCIRLGRDDLHYLYDAVPLGTPIFIH